MRLPMEFLLGNYARPVHLLARCSCVRVNVLSAPLAQEASATRVDSSRVADHALRVA